MSAPEPRPRTRRVDGQWLVDVPGEADPFRVLSWNPPHLTLARGDEVRHFFVASGSDVVWIGDGGHALPVPRSSRSRSADGGAAVEGHDDLSSPMPGTVLEVLVEVGQEVDMGQRLLIVEAMKMENPLRAPHKSIVTALHVGVGDPVAPGETLVELEAGE